MNPDAPPPGTEPDQGWNPRGFFRRSAFLHLLLILSLVGFCEGDYFYNLLLGQRRADEWTKELTPAKIQLDEQCLSSFKTGSTEEQRRLREQFKAINNFLQWHLYIAKQYFAFAYGATAGVYTSAAIAALALFWIAKKGVASANPYIITTFAVCTAMAISFQTFSTTGKHKENIDANVSAYLQYINLGNEILSYAVTGLDQSGKAVEASEFIHRVDSQMSKLNSAAIGYDPSKTPQYTISTETKLH